jgi:hydrogenase nickel incorporation protein HypA/HybF
MHEESLVRGLLRQVEALAARYNGRRVAVVKVAVGEFSGVEPELLEAAFVRQVEATALRGAAIQVTKTALEAECGRCHSKFRVQRFVFVCPMCHNTRVRVTGGEELLLDSVTMEGES